MLVERGIVLLVRAYHRLITAISPQSTDPRSQRRIINAVFSLLSGARRRQPSVNVPAVQSRGIGISIDVYF